MEQGATDDSQHATHRDTGGGRMGKRPSAFLRGLASTMDVWPPPPIAPMSADERMRRVWERTGQALQRAMTGTSVIGHLDEKEEAGRRDGPGRDARILPPVRSTAP